jgi:hypothetical protein
MAQFQVRYIFFLAIILLTMNQGIGQEQSEITEEELKLYQLIMDYRKSEGLPEIPLSKSLTYVAQVHCRDLADNKPDLKSGCNAHSWSDKGEWTACCYTRDHKQAECMWNKPKELTNYPGYGFEIAGGSSDPRYKGFVMTAQYALESWQKSYHHNNVILNKDIWADSEWKAIGIGIYKGFTTVWFGKEEDPEGEVQY